MWVSVCVTPGTLFSRPGMTSASSSCARTRTMATMSNSPVTEYTSLTSGILAIISATSGMRWISALTRTIAVTTGCLPGCLGQIALPPYSGWRLRYYVWPGAELIQGADAAVRQPADQPAEHVRGGPRVGQRAMARRRASPEESGQRAQLAVGHLVRVHHLPGQHDRVQHGEAGPGQPAVAAPGYQEAQVERRVMRDQHASPGEVEQAGQHRAQPRGRGQHPVGDPGQVRDARRNRYARVDQPGELALPQAPTHLPIPLHSHRPDLRDRRHPRRPPRSLQVHHCELHPAELDLSQLPPPVRSTPVPPVPVPPVPSNPPPVQPPPVHPPPVQSPPVQSPPVQP